MTAPRLAAAAIVLSTVTAIAGTTLADATSIDDRSPDKTIPTLPSTTAGPATSGSSTTGIGVPAQASLPQFFPVVNNVIGATGDVASELSVVADVPEGILSPDGSSIRQFSVVYDASNQQFVATATFSSDATAEDAVVFFQATLSAAGFTPVADSGAPEGNETSRELRFENPNSTLDGAGVEVVVDERRPDRHRADDHRLDRCRRAQRLHGVGSRHATGPGVDAAGGVHRRGHGSGIR